MAEPERCRDVARSAREHVLVQRDRTIVVLGLADAGVVARAFEARIDHDRYPRARGVQGVGAERHDGHDRDAGDCARARCRATHHRYSVGGRRFQARNAAQLVAAPAHRTDVAWIAPVVAERLPQQFHALRHGFLVDHRRCPHARDQCVESDHAVAGFEQEAQQLEAQPRHVEDYAVALDALALEVDAQVIEAVRRCGGHETTKGKWSSIIT